MKKIRKEYRKIKGPDKKYFDKLNLRHPYADTRILYGDPKRQVKNIMVGIDVDAEELITAYLLNEKGTGIDLALSHHPSGKALADLHRVMEVHVDIYRKMGVSENIARALEEERIGEVYRRIAPSNNERNVDIARLLNMPYMCVHTPADNHVQHFLMELFNNRKPRTVKDVLKLLKAIPEYQDAMGKNAGPHLIAGKESNKAGKIFVDMTGGTEGTKKVFARLSQAGIGTIVGMHMSEAHFKSAKDEFMNVIIAGHIASDTIGLNLLLDGIVKKGDINIIPTSGFVRIAR